MERQGSLAAALVPVDLHDSAPGDAAAGHSVKLGDAGRYDLLRSCPITDIGLTGLVDGFQ
jgi:hypothetical protein